MKTPTTYWRFVTRRFGGLVGLGVAMVLSVAQAAPVPAASLSVGEVEQSLRQVADYILEHPSGRDTRHWVVAPLYDGLLETAYVTGDATYLAMVLDLGTRSGWMPGPRRYHADDHAVGHAWLDIYAMDPSRKERLKPFVERFDEILAEPRTEPLDYRQKDDGSGPAVTDRWTWCDALYMAPPTLARLYSMTGDERYLQFLEKEYRYTYDQLWDADSGLFFRDTRFLDSRTERGKKIFWSRGNGWVYGGLALTLDFLPEDHAFRGFLEELFVEMTAAVVSTRQEDGLWRPSLHDPEHGPVSETSGSGFFIYGLAWGINHGYLDRETYWPVIEQAWTALQTHVAPSGRVGYIQGIGRGPSAVAPEDTEDYGVGAYLIAGAEILRTLKGEGLQEDRPALLKAAEAKLAERRREPQAYARLVPERKDDLAWENDKVAFRTYGPALRDAVENSGVDVWTKRVAHPVIDKWYAADLAGRASYHQDHGEGFDGYKVGDARGCGGLGIWVDGKLVVSDVYQWAAIHWSRPDTAVFSLTFEYPETPWGTVVETKRVTLELGRWLYRAESTFTSKETGEAIAGLPVAIGLLAQSADPFVRKDAEAGVLALWDEFHGQGLGTGIVLEDTAALRDFRIESVNGAKQALVLTQTNDEGRVRFEAGFGWTAQGEFADMDAWLAHLMDR